MQSRGGDSSSEVSEESNNPTIYFGNNIASGNPISTGTVVAGNMSCKLTMTNCYGQICDKDTYSNGTAMRLGASSKIGKMVISFSSAVVKEINVWAAKWTNDDDSIYRLYSSNSTASNATTKTINSTSFERYTWSSLDNDANETSTSITLEGTQTGKKYRICVSKIEFVLASETTTKHTVTYDYGTTRVTGKTSEEVTDGKTVTNPLTDGYTYEDWDGTHKLDGWYKKDKTKFDFNTAITEDITLYAKWVLSSETQDSKNIKTSETKAQLNYTYKEVIDVTTTATIVFGEKTGAATTATTSSYSYLNDEIDIKNITFNARCFGSQKSDDNYALKMGNASAIGSFTINFNSSIAIKGVNITASAWSGDTAKYQVYSNVNTTGKNIVFTNEGNPTTEYKWEDFTGDNDLDNGIGEKSSSITITGTNISKGRAYISKIELIIATGETVSSDTPIYNISNIGLRFGGTVKKSYYEALESHIKSFGMVYTTKDKLGEYETLTSALDAGVTESTFNVKMQEITDTIKPIEQTIDGEQYYVWNVYINVSSSSLDKVIYTAGKLTLDNGTSFYLKERSASVKDIALEYYCDDTAEYSDEVKATLELLADGKTKTDTTSSTDTSSSSSEEGE